MDFKTGGQDVIKRLLEVYGFSSRQALAEHFGISHGTMGTRWMRDYFPADWVIQCAIETGVSVEWLSFGKGEKKPLAQKNLQNESQKAANEALMNDAVTIKRKKIINGNIHDSNFNIFDKAMIPSDVSDPVLILENNKLHLVDYRKNDVIDGKWLVCIEGKYGIKDITRIPVGKIIVRDNKFNFQCEIKDVEFIGKVAFTINYED